MDILTGQETSSDFVEVIQRICLLIGTGMLLDFSTFFVMTKVGSEIADTLCTRVYQCVFSIEYI